MIWSVSTLLRRSGIPTPVCVRKASIVVSLEGLCWLVGRSGTVAGAGRCRSGCSAGARGADRRAVRSVGTGKRRHRLEIGRGGQGSAHRGGGGDQRRDQVGAAALALPTLEVAVRRRRAALAGRELIGVHAKAHRASGAAPLGAGRGENRVQTLGLGLRLHPHRTGHHQHPQRRVDVPAAQHVGGRPQVLDPAVGAGSEKHGVDVDLPQRRAGRQAHVLQRPLGGAALVVVTDQFRVRDTAADNGSP